MSLPWEDQLAIHKLMADYNFAADAGDGEAWADLFVEEGSMDSGMGLVVRGGRAKLVEFANSVPKMTPGGRHLVMNISIDGQGSDATARSYLQVWLTSATPGQTRLAMCGVYEDVLRKVGGQWKFVTRVVRPDRGGPVARAGA